MWIPIIALSAMTFLIWVNSLCRLVCLLSPMPPELRKAHIANDKAVMAAYGFGIKMTEEECVAELMKLYQKMQR